MVTRRNDERTVAGRHRMMRRADREVTEPQQIDAIIATCKIVNIAYTDAEGITIVPLNFGYVFDTESNHLTLYFHGSATGRKMDAVKAAGNALPVAFEMATDCEVVEGARCAIGARRSSRSSAMVPRPSSTILTRRARGSHC